MRAIVTGGAGFIGSHVVDALIARGDEVLVVDNLSTGKSENVAEGARLEVADIRESLASIFDETEPEVCFHLAAQADVVTSVERPEYDTEVNVLGTVRVLEGARRHDTAVVFSSTGGAVYGECERPAKEDDELRPLSPYGTAKLAGEAYLATWARLYGMRNVALRLGNVYGPRQLPSLEGGVIAIFLNRLNAGEPTQIFGDGRQTRDFVYVGDVAAAMLAAAGKQGVYNVGTGVETSVVELHALAARVAGLDVEPAFAPPRAGELQRSFVDPSLAGREFGWRAQHSLEEGLRLTWDSVARAAA